MAGELKIAHFMSPRHPQHRFLMTPWAKQLGEMSGGKLTARVFPAGQLGKGGPAQYKRVVDGIADIGYGLPGFTSALFPRTTVIELPAVANSAVDGANKLWDAFEKFLQPEFARVKVLALFANENQMLMTKDRPIRKVSDLKGLKIRTPSRVQSKSIRALGATPVAMPVNRIYNALNTGVVDGVLIAPSTIISFKLGEVAKYYTVGMPLGRSPFYLIMNKKKWQDTSPEHQALIDKTTGRKWSIKAANIYERAGKKGIDSITNTGKHEIITLSPSELSKATDILQKARSRMVADLEKKGVPAKAILTAMGVGN
jgi:TRAP-type C4-dicarboxylate transport system substrate-binding protein